MKIWKLLVPMNLSYPTFVLNERQRKMSSAHVTLPSLMQISLSANSKLELYKEKFSEKLSYRLAKLMQRKTTHMLI